MNYISLGNEIRRMLLTEREKEFILACTIGDGSLVISGRKNYRLCIAHASKFKSYVEWKYNSLESLCVSPIRYSQERNAWAFGTVGHPWISELRRQLYKPCKQIPCNLVLTPLIIAVWFMDDGTRHRDTVDFSVHGFSGDSINILREQLLKFNITTTHNHDSKGSRIYVIKKSYNAFKILIKPYVIECMNYKLP